MKKEDIIEAFQRRHACKEFDRTKKISDDDFEVILEAARLSPSSFGFEPWHFVVVQDPTLREALKEGAWGATLKLDTASHFVLGLTLKAPYTRYNSPYINDFMSRVQQLPAEVIEAKGGFYRNFQTTDFKLESDSKLFDWASKQAYIPLGNMMTVAALLGIDSCPIEGFDKLVSETILHDKLGIDTRKYGLSYMVAFGYRVKEPHAKTRRCVDEVVSWK